MLRKVVHLLVNRKDCLHLLTHHDELFNLFHKACVLVSINCDQDSLDTIKNIQTRLTLKLVHTYMKVMLMKINDKELSRAALAKVNEGRRSEVKHHGHGNSNRKSKLEIVKK